MLSLEQQQRLEGELEKFALGLLSNEEDSWIKAKRDVLIKSQEAQRECPKELAITAKKQWIEDYTRAIRYEFDIADHKYKKYIDQINAAKFVLRTK